MLTIFEGSEEDSVSRDDAAYGTGKTVSKSCNHIIEGSKKDNFWEMGENWVHAAPCSEIHIDIRDDRKEKELPDICLLIKVIHMLSRFGTCFYSI